MAKSKIKTKRQARKPVVKKSVTRKTTRKSERKTTRKSERKTTRKPERKTTRKPERQTTKKSVVELQRPQIKTISYSSTYSNINGKETSRSKRVIRNNDSLRTIETKDKKVVTDKTIKLKPTPLVSQEKFARPVGSSIRIISPRRLNISPLNIRSPLDIIPSRKLNVSPLLKLLRQKPNRPVCNPLDKFSKCKSCGRVVLL